MVLRKPSITGLTLHPTIMGLHSGDEELFCSGYKSSKEQKIPCGQLGKRGIVEAPAGSCRLPEAANQFSMTHGTEPAKSELEVSNSWAIGLSHFHIV